MKPCCPLKVVWPETATVPALATLLPAPVKAKVVAPEVTMSPPAALVRAELAAAKLFVPLVAHWPEFATVALGEGDTSMRPVMAPLLTIAMGPSGCGSARRDDGTPMARSVAAPPFDRIAPPDVLVIVTVAGEKYPITGSAPVPAPAAAPPLVIDSVDAE